MKDLLWCKNNTKKGEEKGEGKVGNRTFVKLFSKLSMGTESEKGSLALETVNFIV